MLIYLTNLSKFLEQKVSEKLSPLPSSDKLAMDFWCFSHTWADPFHCYPIESRSPNRVPAPLSPIKPCFSRAIWTSYVEGLETYSKVHDVFLRTAEENNTIENDKLEREVVVGEPFLPALSKYFFFEIWLSELSLAGRDACEVRVWVDLEARESTWGNSGVGCELSRWLWWMDIEKGRKVRGGFQWTGEPLVGFWLCKG